MPNKPKHPCNHVGCRQLTTERFCDQHAKQHQQQQDRERGTAHQRGYNTRWQKARKTFLSRNPLCRHCQDEGFLTPATVVDHVIPHRGDQDLFWDSNNWQPLCKRHHDIKTAKEDGGFGR
ncbi:HNH endonuclease signature motif containing protein [Paenibacillus sp.]|uniref:HNH endonuclease n=1 Tax=Paenibacillus sp. TaxID=58172 RepID=UPI002D29CA38|nr:HNH endonuclease signature motif containing protein [Paenibacillus sp.]HZG83844.1 HNH endonuclease signature motif containing protein [Paenibacillus sp.]